MGLQVLMTESDENEGTECLDIIDGKVMSLKNHIGDSLKIPHMGWNKVCQSQNHPVWSDIQDNSFFYFVHSYFVQLNNIKEIMSTTEYGTKFTSAVSRSNLIAVQFHPEKSSFAGKKFLDHFFNSS